MSATIEQPLEASVAGALPAVVSFTATRPREYGLDWLRVIVFVILIGYHTGMYFVPWPWMVKNPESCNWLQWVMIFFNRWRLPLLFFISGAGTWFNLQRRGAGEFARERVRRLALPLAFGVFVIVPPQIYVERIVAGRHYSSYFHFWGTVFTLVPYPHGNLSFHHLWFIPYIFTYSLLGLPLFVLLLTSSGRLTVDRLARLCERSGFIYLINTPIVAAALMLVPHWPTTYNLISDWANFTVSLLYFVLGFIICGSERFLSLVENRRREFLFVSAIMLVVFYGIRVDNVMGAFSPTTRYWIFTIVDSYFALTMILALVAWSRAKLNRDSATLRYTNTAVYPFYIVHQTIAVSLGYMWLEWHIPFAVKFPLLFVGTFLGSWAIYEAVRRHRVTRMLFGMKS